MHIYLFVIFVGKCLLKCKVVAEVDNIIPYSVIPSQFGTIWLAENGSENETISLILYLSATLFCWTIMTLCMCIIFTPEAKVDYKMVVTNAFEFVIANGCKTEHAIFLIYDSVK